MAQCQSRIEDAVRCSTISLTAAWARSEIILLLQTHRLIRNMEHQGIWISKQDTGLLKIVVRRLIDKNSKRERACYRQRLLTEGVLLRRMRNFGLMSRLAWTQQLCFQTPRHLTIQTIQLASSKESEVPLETKKVSWPCVELSAPFKSKSKSWWATISNKEDRQPRPPIAQTLRATDQTNWAALPTGSAKAQPSLRQATLNRSKNSWNHTWIMCHQLCPRIKATGL